MINDLIMNGYWGESLLSIAVIFLGINTNLTMVDHVTIDGDGREILGPGTNTYPTSMNIG